MKNLFTIVGLAIATMLPVTPASAITMSITPSAQSTMIGGAANVDIVVSGLNAVSEIVAAFDVDLLYDPTILEAHLVNLNVLAFGDADALTFINFLPGQIDINLTSLLADADIELLQGDSVLLGSITFHGIADGVSALSFDADLDFGRNVVGRDAQSLSLTAGSACIAVGAGACGVVPEPEVLPLIALGLLALGVTRCNNASRRS